MRTLADEEVLFSETDLINMGINRHDAKYILKMNGVVYSWRSTKRNFISEYELERRLERHGCYLVRDGTKYRIIGQKII